MRDVKRKKVKKVPAVSRAGAARELARQVGRRIREMRTELGWSQQQLSAHLGRANNNAVSRLERGQPDLIAFDILEGLIALAVRQGKTAEWLLTGDIVSASAPPEEVIRVAGPLMVLELLRNPMAYSGPEADERRMEQIRRVLGLRGPDDADKTGGQ